MMNNEGISMRIMPHYVLQEKQRTLLGKNNFEDRRAFLKFVMDGQDAFCNHLESWGMEGDNIPPTLSKPMSENQFKDPPFNIEKRIYETWSFLTPSLAAKPGTWVSICIELMRQDLIKSHFFAALGNTTTGREAILLALSQNSNDVGKSRDKLSDCTRRVLRRLGGVVERGYRTTWLDCPLAKAWWRHRYAIEAHEQFNGSLSVEELSRVLRGQVWEPLVQSMISRLTVIGDAKVRPSVIRWLTEHQPKDRVIQAKECQDVLNRVGRASVATAFGTLEMEDAFERISQELQEVAL